MRKTTKQKFIEYNPANDPKRMHGYKNVRWVENVSRGLRLVGFADKVADEAGSHAIEHQGWFTDDDFQDEVYRGVVYQLPVRDGETQFVYGYADPNNDDCALLCFEPFTDKLEAAKQADRFAELMAESERDYRRADSARIKYDELADEIKQARTTALKIAAEMRAAKQSGVSAPTICATLRSKILSLYRSIQKARKERAELMDSYGNCEGFTE
jgi:hypothetical protein